jgi:lipoprotein-anchoring transpeptidase ErfK/SrfK|tara:strand:+ start:1726 stop:2352 length:627 start_codon:yes stop_codon:yes gene_type:complete
MIKNSRKGTILFLISLLFSCSSLDLKKQEIIYKNNTINNNIPEINGYKSYDSILLVDIRGQVMSLVIEGTVSREFIISSSSYGTGSLKNSLKTPLGKHVIYKKIGEDLPVNAILKGRKWSGAIANIVSDPVDTDYDHVTSRILWLDGLEVGSNKGKNVDSKSRYIYIHGTAEEGLLGQPASDGCIRMYNTEVIELFNLVEEGTQVWIY